MEINEYIILIMNNFLYFFEIQVYYLQQIIYNFLSSELHNFTPYIFMLLLTGGLLTSINPCSISILPLSVSYIDNKKNNHINKYTFIAGLISSLIIIFSLSILLNNYYYKLILNIPIFSSIIIIIIGLNFLKIFNLNFFTINILQFHPFNFNIDSNFSNFIIGLMFGLSSCSCSTPILATLLFWLSNTHNILSGIIYILCYMLGYIIPLFILIEITINYTKIKIISQIWNYLMPVSGSFILGIGLFSLLNHIFIY
uniref:thiol:disulfide interchange protein n=1 Tax=Anunuuluaehu liula TaxID=3049639 RepID=UPI003003749F